VKVRGQVHREIHIAEANKPRIFSCVFVLHLEHPSLSRFQTFNIQVLPVHLGGNRLERDFAICIRVSLIIPLFTTKVRDDYLHLRRQS
jgi:hypothetical protein